MYEQLRHDMSDDELLGRLRSLGPAPTDLSEPPADLWSRIAAEVSADESDEGLAPTAEVAEFPAPAMADAGGPVRSNAAYLSSVESDDVAAEEAPDAVAPVVPLRRRRAPRLLVAAAAALVAVAGIATLVLTGGSSGETTVVLEALVDGDDGSARLLQADDGSFVIEVDYDGSAGDNEFLELWVIDSAVSDPQSLGRYDGSGRYRVPSDIDLDEYPVIDISVEENDGDPTHSGLSVVRGSLT